MVNARKATLGNKQLCHTGRQPQGHTGRGNTTLGEAISHWAIDKAALGVTPILATGNTTINKKNCAKQNKTTLGDMKKVQYSDTTYTRWKLMLEHKRLC